MPLSHDTSELSADEIELLSLYRKTGTLPEKMRVALKETLLRTIELYAASVPKKERPGKKESGKRASRD